MNEPLFIFLAIVVVVAVLAVALLRPKPKQDRSPIQDDKKVKAKERPSPKQAEAQSSSLEATLSQTLDDAIKLTGAERGYVVLDNGGVLNVVASRNIGQDEFFVNRSVTEEALASGKAIITTNAEADARYASQDKIANLTLRSIVTVPLREGDKVIGAIYLDNRVRQGIFSEDDLSKLESLAQQRTAPIADTETSTLVGRRLPSNREKHKTQTQQALPKPEPPRRSGEGLFQPQPGPASPPAVAPPAPAPSVSAPPEKAKALEQKESAVEPEPEQPRGGAASGGAALDDLLADRRDAKEEAPPPPPPVPQPAPITTPAPAEVVAPGGGVPRMDEKPAAEPPPSTGAKPDIATENVRFTAFHPKEANVEAWYSLLVYAHIESAVEKVRSDAAKFKEEMGNVQREVKAAAPAKLARGTEIAIVPTCDGVTFNPERVTFKWIEDLHRADFRFRASKDLADSAANIIVAIYVGPLIVATIKGGLLFNAESASAAEPATMQHMTMNMQTTATMYQAEQIFPSYSHDDEEIVVACRNAYKAIGFEFLRDRDTLRPGQDWNTGLRQMIDKADIFQLFWSKQSAESKYVRQEWEYALQQQQKKGGDFIRPVYWQQPMIDPPAELSSLHFTYVPLGKGE